MLARKYFFSLIICFLISFPLGTAEAAPPGRESLLDSAGFEIGNGKRLIRNPSGLYGMKISNSWRHEFFGQLTEIVSGFSGRPKARLRISMETDENIQTFADLVLLFRRKMGWSIDKIAGLDAILKEEELSDGHCMLDAKVFRAPGEVAVITLDGAPDCRGPSAYGTIKTSLETFHFIH